jgi:hypothetical protein
VGQVLSRLGGIRADLQGVYMELNRERDGARARRAVAALALLGAALSLMAVTRFRGAGKKGALMKMLAAFALAGGLAASCRAPLPESGGPRADMRAVVQRAERMAGRAEALAVSAWELGKIAVETRRDLSALFGEALKAAREVRNEEYLHYAQALRLKSQGWPPYMEQRADEAALRLERAASRVWPLRALAGQLGGINKARALSLLKEAASLAREMQDRQLRDIELRGIAAEMAMINPALAMQTASLIEAPYYRSWALRAIGEARGDRKVLRSALSEAQKIEAPAGLAGNEKDRLLYQKAMLLARTALAMDRAGAARDRTLEAVDTAVSVAESILGPYERAYAYSSLASLVAPVDVPTAAYIASRIVASGTGQAYPDAYSSARLSIAVEMARRDYKAALGELGAVFEIAGGIEDLYDRQKTIGRAVYILGGLRPDEAVRRISGPEGRPPVKFPLVVAEALGPAILREPPEEAERFLEGKGPGVRAELYTALANRWISEDRARGQEYFQRALSAARQEESPYLLWTIASSWGRYDPGKLHEATARPMGSSAEERGPRPERVDHYFSAAASLALAVELQSAGDREGAAGAFGIALGQAMKIEEPYLRSEALKDISRHAARTDRDISLRAFEAALEAARALGAPDGD